MNYYKMYIFFFPPLFGATIGTDNDTLALNLSVKVAKVQCD